MERVFKSRPLDVAEGAKVQSLEKAEGALRLDLKNLNNGISY